MVTTRSRSAEIPANLKRKARNGILAPTTTTTIATPKPTPPVTAGKDEGYERLRDERIRENLERMQKFGLVDLALKIKSERLTSPKRRALKSPSDRKVASFELQVLPLRRSSRLNNVAPISYAEIRVKRERGTRRSGGRDAVDVISGDEVYTEEHDKLLGTCETPWTLFVDGYGADGRRIYDQIRGKSCHQCRQKTLGCRTHCNQCELVQGQFCGDCLYMRYGENVLEAKKNPYWVCPVCRGICNCSLCRVKKGWAPTGALYRKVLSLGFKSVAHYLIQTRRAQENSESSDSAKLCEEVAAI